MKHPFVQYILAILTVVSAFFSWFTIHAAITDSGASTWIVPISVFSILFIILCLDAVLLEHDILLPATILVSFFLNLIFAFDIFHGGILVMVSLIVIWAMHRVKKHMKLFLKVVIIEALQPATLLFVLALTVAISSQYFAEVKMVNPQEMIMRFRGGGTMDAKILNSLSYINPKLKHLGDEKMTVDQFILEMSKEQLDKELGIDSIFTQQIDKEITKLYGDNISAETRDKLKAEMLSETENVAAGISEENKKLVLEEGRRKLSELAGMALQGTEPMSIVFTNIVNWQLVNKIAPASDDSRFPIFAILMAAILFLTIFPLGSIFRSLYAYLTSFIFYILVKTGALAVSKIPAEKEVIE